MKVIPLEGTTLTVPELVRLAEGGAVILTRDGLPLVSVRDVHNSDWESTSLAHNAQFAAIVEKSRASHRDRGGVSMADVRRELGLDADPPDA